MDPDTPVSAESATTTPGPEMTAAEKRAEARKRRLALGNERLARIKALSTGKEVPSLEEAEKEWKANQGARETPVPSAATVEPPVQQSTLKKSSSSDSHKVSTKPKKSKPTAPATPALSMQEQAMLLQMQEKLWVQSLRRWKWIHTLTFVVGSAGLFYWMIMEAMRIHLNGLSTFGSLVVGLSIEEPVPVMNIFTILVSMEAVLVTSRYLFDKASPPPSNLPQLGISPGMARKLSSWTQSLESVSHMGSQLMLDFSHTLFVFGVGILWCWYQMDP